MYQVITMYGENEPWWFFDEWQSDIQEEKEFSTLTQAQDYYREQWQKLHMQYSYIQARPNYLSAFWNEDEALWCGWIGPCTAWARTTGLPHW